MRSVSSTCVRARVCVCASSCVLLYSLVPIAIYAQCTGTEGGVCGAPSNMATWHNFEFFDVELVTDSAGKHVLRELEVLCWASGRNQLLFGDHEGVVRLYDRTFQCQQFRAYQGPVYHLLQLKRCLVTIGDDDADEQCLLKVWSVDRDNERPVCLGKTRLFGASFPAPEPERVMLNVNRAIDLDYTTHDKEIVSQSSFSCPVTTLAVAESDDYHLLAVGLTSGDVVLIKGHLVRDRDKQKQTVLRRSYCPGSPTKVTFMSFRKLPAKQGGYAYTLHVLYEDGASLWHITNKSETQDVAMGDVTGCQLRQACIADDGRLIVARKDLLTLYGGEDMKENENSGSKTPAPGSDIRSIGWFGDYMYTVATMGAVDKDQFTVYDFANQLKATPNQCAFPNVVCVLSEWSCLYVLFQVVEKGSNRVNQRLAKLEEKDTQTKLKLLYKKAMYQIAIDLAKAHSFDTSDVMDIYLRYGDYLYQRTDYGQAVQQYIATIGHKEPSYVIRRFLDAQQIHHLTRYLEKLHTKRDASDRPLANEDHTTLLLNCYTKLKDEKKLDEFIKEERNYNPDTAIKVLRQANYERHALHLADKFSKHSAFLSIQVDDLKQYDDALMYIHSLEFDHAVQQLREYGKVLVSKRPMKATSLLMEICTGWKRQCAPQAVGDGHLSATHMQEEGGRHKANPDEFLPCFVDVPQHLMTFLEVVKNDLDVKAGLEGPTMVYNTLLELYLTKNIRQKGKGREEAADDEKAAGDASGGASTLDAAAAAAAAATASDDAEDFDDDDDYAERKEKALALLRDNKGQYDREHALVLVQTHNFREGILFLYESLELYQDILQYYMEVQDKDGVVRTCERFGKQDPTMWVQVLLYFVALHETEDVSAETQKVLKHIDEERLLSPLVVVDILGRSKGTKLSTVKDYIVKRLEKDMGTIEQDQKVWGGGGGGGDTFCLFVRFDTNQLIYLLLPCRRSVSCRR